MATGLKKQISAKLIILLPIVRIFDAEIAATEG